MRTLVVWHNLNNNSYYYRFVINKRREYKVGYINQYNHKIVLLISSREVQPILIKKYISIRKSLCELLIRFLEWFSK